VFLVLGALVVVNLYVFVWDKRTSVAAIKREAESKTPAATLPHQDGATSPSEPEARGPRPEAPKLKPMLEGEVGKSDTLGKLLKRSGLSGAESDEVIRALEPVLDFRTIRTGQTFKLQRAADGRVHLFELDVGKHRVRAERTANGTLAATTVP
jgi:hypothetical protein